MFSGASNGFAGQGRSPVAVAVAAITPVMPSRNAHPAAARSDRPHAGSDCRRDVSRRRWSLAGR
jgi:hypothetical protein